MQSCLHKEYCVALVAIIAAATDTILTMRAHHAEIVSGVQGLEDLGSGLYLQAQSSEAFADSW